MTHVNAILRLARAILGKDKGEVSFKSGMVILSFVPSHEDLHDPVKSGLIRFDEFSEVMKDGWNGEERIVIGHPDVVDVTTDGLIVIEVRARLVHGLMNGFPPMDGEDKVEFHNLLKRLGIGGYVIRCNDAR